MMIAISLGLLAYLLGSIPTGKLLAATAGVDIQSRGSGNIGFANVQRVLGWRFGLPTLAADIVKGFLPTFLALVITGSMTAAVLVGFMAIAGHIWPVWLRFKGGKGIATGLGVVLAITPFTGAAAGLVYVLIRLLKLPSWWASLAGTLIAASGFVALYPQYWWASLLLGCVPLYTLRHNMRGTVPNYG